MYRVQDWEAVLSMYIIDAQLKQRERKPNG